MSHKKKRFDRDLGERARGRYTVTKERQIMRKSHDWWLTVVTFLFCFRQLQ